MYYNRLLLPIVFFCCLSCSQNSDEENAPPETETTFSNPLLSHGADPWVVQYDGGYYYTHTVGNRIDIYHTKNLGELSTAQVKTVWRPDGGENAMNIWAPEIHRINGKWYIYYTAGSDPDLSTQRSFVLECSGMDPMQDEWIEKGRIYDPAADFFAIDGSILEYKDVLYFIYSGHPSETDNTQNIYIARMENPWTLASPRHLLSTPTYAWEIIGDPKVNEGPEMLKNRAGNLMIIFSASGCWTDDYTLGMLQFDGTDDVLNPDSWSKHSEPVFSKVVSDNVYAPGHNGFFKSPDGTQDWIIYHANSESGAGCTDKRSPRMQRFTWNENGTPDFGEPVKTGKKLELPSGTIDENN